MKPPLKISTAAVPSPAKMPPAIARNVTRMLLVKISLDSAAWSPGAERARPAARLGRALERGRHHADRRGGVVDRPHRGERERSEQQHQRGDERPRDAPGSGASSRCVRNHHTDRRAPWSA